MRTPRRSRHTLTTTRGPSFWSAVALAMLAGCATGFDLPSVAEASLVADGNTILVNSLHCLPTGEVVAAGEKDSFADREGVLLRSDDRGDTWRRVPLQAPGISLSLLVLPGEPGAVFHASGYRTGTGFSSMVTTRYFEPGPWWVTRDNGRSWEASDPRLPLPPTNDVSARLPEIVRADQGGTLVGVVASHRHLVALRSSDGGRTWSSHDLAKLGHYASLVTDGRGSVVVTGRANVIQSATPSARRIVGYLSDDAGGTWREAGEISEIDFPGAWRLHETHAGSILAYGNDESSRGGYPSLVYRSIDGGRTWRPAHRARGTGRVVGIAGDATGRVVALTSGGVILLSTDDGASWRTAHATDATTQSSVIVFSNDGAILVAQDRGRFVRSSDGGETWRVVDSGLPDRKYVLNAHCTDGRGLIVVGGSGGMVTRSTDWGATWRSGRLDPASPH